MATDVLLVPIVLFVTEATFSLSRMYRGMYDASVPWILQCLKTCTVARLFRARGEAEGVDGPEEMSTGGLIFSNTLSSGNSAGSWHEHARREEVRRDLHLRELV